MSVSAFLLLGLVGLGPAAAGQPAGAEVGPHGEAVCAEDPGCRSLLDRGKGHVNAGQMADALTCYEGAYQMRADPQLLYNMARLAHRLGRIDDAERRYQMFLDAGAAGDLTRKSQVEDYLRALQATGLAVGIGLGVAAYRPSVTGAAAARPFDP